LIDLAEGAMQQSRNTLASAAAAASRRPQQHISSVAALEGDGPDDDHVVDGRKSSADEGAHPEDPLQINIYIYRFIYL